MRSDDHGLLSQVLNDRRAASAELRRLAPGVLVSGLGADEVLTVLRDAGYAPAGENPGGAVLTRPPARPRAAGRRPGTEPSPAAAPADDATSSTPPCGEMRAGDAALSARRGEAVRQIPGVTTASTLELLSRAVARGTPVWLGYVDAQGSGSQRVVQPVSLVGGFLQGYDERRGENSTFAVHRITSVALVEEDQEPAAAP